jgi:hypothetical protein
VKARTSEDLHVVTTKWSERGVSGPNDLRFESFGMKVKESGSFREKKACFNVEDDPDSDSDQLSSF